jgi:peptidyl-prolyl cis-trans isomerase C
MSMKNRFIAAGLVAGVILLVACDKRAEPEAAETGASAAATVNGKAISQSVYDVYAKSASRQANTEMTADHKAQLLDQLINLKLASEAATKAGLDKRDDVQAQLELVRMNVLAEADFSKYLSSNPPSDAEIQSEYNAQIAAMPQEYKARHILVDNEQKAKDIITKLDKGGDFSELAKAESKDESAKNGGDLGWFTLQSMVKPFSEAVAQLDKGSYTKAPVQSQFGWHVIKLEDTRKGEPPDLEKVRDQVVSIVQRKKLQLHIDDLRGKATIQKTN